MSESLPLASLGSASSPIKVTLSDLDGIHVVDIRKYYLEKRTGELKPTQKGIAVKEENFTELVAVLSENESQILEWLRSSVDNTTAIGRMNIRQNTLSQPIRVIHADDSSTRGSRFFECEHQGSEIKVSFSTSHPFFKERTRLEGGDSTSQLIATLLAALEVAHQMSSTGEVVGTGLVSYPALMMNWGVALKHLLKSQES